MTDSRSVAAPIVVRALGLVPYRDALAFQEDAVRARAAGEAPDTLFLLEHPPVLTAGRGTGEGSVRAAGAELERAGLEVVPVSRGGDVTWHGPGQLVGYCICDLEARGKDLHRFLRGLEQGLIDTLAHFGIDAARSAGRTGVWVGDEKIASIGIAVRRWVSWHGFALNVRPSLEHFGLIHPCGLRGVQMTSMARLLGDACPAWPEVLATVAERVPAALGSAAAVAGGALDAPAPWSETATPSARSAAPRDARPVAAWAHGGASA